ncbi:DUF2442 domain-containing protein [Parabacteroides sp. OttesenSCG-928-O15]|nr:DUF2442 domain-containing protein [Parabacteroides sp. OttesenSCG-928-O15]
MKVAKLWFNNEKIYILLDDGRELWQSLLWYPRLKKATDKQRLDYKIKGEGIRWEELDEDISLASFLYDDPKPTGVSLVFHTFPELNASAMARRLGMKQSLLAAYISGAKKPSREQEQRIKDAIRDFARELYEINQSS